MPDPADLTNKLATPAHKHVVAFDGLRAIAFLAVLVAHSDILLSEAYRITRWTRRITDIGWCGVDLFFVLSGFLITGILLNTRTASNYFQSFYARRALRIFPVYYLALCILVATRGYWDHLGMPLPPNPVWLFTYLNNWMSPKAPPAPYGAVVGHFWSLAVEEQFYCLWPFCVWMAGPRHLWKVCIAGITIAVVARCYFVRLYGPSWFVYEALLTRMDTLLMGALAALVARNANALKWIKVMARPVGIVTVTATLGVAILLRDY